MRAAERYGDQCSSKTEYVTTGMTRAVASHMRKDGSVMLSPRVLREREKGKEGRGVCECECEELDRGRKVKRGKD